MRNQITRFFQSSTVLSVAGFIMGLVSIFGGIAAWSYSDSRELYRYPVAAFVMLCSGILWLGSSFISKYRLTRKHYTIVLAVLLFGLIVGLVDAYSHCGGECGCFWDYGYPGRWLRISTCVTGQTLEPLWMRNWEIDFPSFAADIVFWSGAGLIVALIWHVNKNKKRITSGN